MVEEEHAATFPRQLRKTEAFGESKSGQVVAYVVDIVDHTGESFVVGLRLKGSRT